MKYRSIGVIALGALLIAGVPGVHAQPGGSVSGLVKDSSGAVLPGATVVMTNLATGQPREATTNVSGTYNFAFVPPGGYSISIDLAGFRKTPPGSDPLKIQFPSG